ncbi:DUF6151 family protein [Pseudomonas neustonica]|uniref:CENP-V/GFA domain-containing protein n=1 Tax=Pseudomonas neustonica TaxID=2487346 RepID=A0ABX9XH96_9PSED|nr:MULTISPECIES: DUF6151 family protein [Pseudomonas]MBA6421677.1 hypothetical protein [Pseudomonas sp. 5Ae-yellow]ROZ82214.1 hypothetical protein EF099_12710 [Pseudomonas sp. SSM44]ROZ84054.1 hypothetical protein EF096_11455 [Pseudomonas neustonica]
MDNLVLQCGCGQIKGRAIKINPADRTRVICYCKDCQAFAHALKASAQVLDEQGGTDIYQLPPARLQINQGLEQIRCLRLSEKGLYRWYAGCCNTPIGNTLSPRVPMIGLIHSFIFDPEREAKLGPVRACVNLRGATGQIPKSRLDAAPASGYIGKIMLKILGWKLGGLGRPNPLFSAKGEPLASPRILRPGETV